MADKVKAVNLGASPARQSLAAARSASIKRPTSAQSGAAVYPSQPNQH